MKLKQTKDTGHVVENNKSAKDSTAWLVRKDVADELWFHVGSDVSDISHDEIEDKYTVIGHGRHVGGVLEYECEWCGSQSQQKQSQQKQQAQQNSLLPPEPPKSKALPPPPQRTQRLSQTQKGGKTEAEELESYRASGSLKAPCGCRTCREQA